MTAINKRKKYLKILYGILPFISISILICIWYFHSGEGIFDFPTPKNVFKRFMDFLEHPVMKLTIWEHIGISLLRVLVALFFAWVLGTALGVALGWNKKVNALLSPLFNAFRSVPPLAWIPLITIWFGIGEFPKILIIFIGAVMPVVVNAQTGVESVDRTMLDVGYVFSANSRQLLFSIVIPASFTEIFAGIRTSASTAWMIVLAAEMLGAKSGVGFLIVRGMNSADLPLVLLAMIFIGLVGSLIGIATSKLERIVCPWTKIKK